VAASSSTGLVVPILQQYKTRCLKSVALNDRADSFCKRALDFWMIQVIIAPGTVHRSSSFTEALPKPAGRAASAMIAVIPMAEFSLHRSSKNRDHWSEVRRDEACKMKVIRCGRRQDSAWVHARSSDTITLSNLIRFLLDRHAVLAWAKL
jgi:hypothetical protein